MSFDRLPGESRTEWADRIEREHPPKRTQLARDVEIEAVEISEAIQESQCRVFTFTNPSTGESFKSSCDSKRCYDCGPIKHRKLWSGIRLRYGAIAWIGRISADEADLISARVRQRRRRGSEIDYVGIWDVGDAEMILVSTEQISASQRKMELSSWKDRIRRAYLRATKAVRISAIGIAQRANGVLERALVTLRPRRSTGSSVTQWEISGESVDLDGFPDESWDDMKLRKAYEAGHPEWETTGEPPPEDERQAEWMPDQAELGF